MALLKVKKSVKTVKTYTVGKNLKVQIEKIVNDVSGRVSYAVVSYKKTLLLGWRASADFANLELNWKGDKVEGGSYPEYGTIGNAKAFAEFIINKRFG